MADQLSPRALLTPVPILALRALGLDLARALAIRALEYREASPPGANHQDTVVQIVGLQEANLQGANLQAVNHPKMVIRAVGQAASQAAVHTAVHPPVLNYLLHRLNPLRP